jgi:hypothetical protein
MPLRTVLRLSGPLLVQQLQRYHPKIAPACKKR